MFAMGDGEHSPVTEGAVIELGPKKDLNRIGNISEKAFDLEASKRGWLVAINSGGAPDFDFIIKRPDKARCVVVQVKTARWVPSENYYQVRTCNSKRGGGTKPYSSTAFDVLAAYLREADSWLFYSRKELGDRMNTTYTPTILRKRKSPGSALDHRPENNWELLDAV
jgi:hypothetical protein